MRTTIIFIFIAFFLTRCGYLIDRQEEIITGNYISYFNEAPTCRAIAKPTGSNYAYVITGYIFAIGHEKEYIIAKRNPNPNCDFKVDTSKTEYFILQVDTLKSIEKKQYGPLDSHSFDSIRQQLNIQNIKFDLVYPRQPQVFAN